MLQGSSAETTLPGLKIRCCFYWRLSSASTWVTRASGRLWANTTAVGFYALTAAGLGVLARPALGVCSAGCAQACTGHACSECPHTIHLSAW